MMTSRGAQIFADQFLRSYKSHEAATFEPEHFEPETLARAFEDLGCGIEWREDRRAFSVYRNGFVPT